MLTPAKPQTDDVQSGHAAWTVSDGRGALAAPAAVRVVDLDAPLANIRLPSARLGEPYQSLVAVVRLDGDPLGVATLPVGPQGLVSRNQLRRALRRQLDAELQEAFAHRGLALPRALPLEGIPSLNGRRGASGRRRRSVSVVVTTCCNPLALERCLRSILATDYDDFEVIVVENRPGSSATRRMLADRFEDELRVLYVEEPRAGLAKARNAGLALAGGDVIAFTDDDVVVDPGWLRRCEEAFERADDVACVTGLIAPLELEDDSQLLLEQFAGFGKGFHRQTYRLPEALDTHPLLPYTAGVVGSGANTVLRADAARRLGGFDTTLGAGTPAAGGEDLDLYIRVLQSGYAVAYEPSAIVWHEHPDGRSRLRRQVYSYGVGLGATLTKQLVVGPERLRLVRAVPAGVRYARDPSSRKNAAKAPGFPRRLEWLERLGMLMGPVAYVVSAVIAATRRWRLSGRGPPSPALCVERLRVSYGRTIEVVTFYDRDLAPPSTPGARRRQPLERRWEAGRAVATPTHRAATATAAAACVAAPLSVAIGLPSTVRLLAVLALMCLAPGTALLTVLRGRFEPGLVLGISLAGSAMLAQSMLWLGVWWPKAFLYGLAAACLPILVSQLDIPSLRRGLRMRLLAGSSPAPWPSSGSPPWVVTPPIGRFELVRVRSAVRRIPPFVVGHGALLTAALVAWAISLVGVDLSRIAGLGLVNAMPPTYFIAFGLLLGGFAHAVTRDELSPKLLGLYVLALVLVIHGTTPLLYDQPRYPWVYKHIAVIDLIATSGGVERQVDIYNNWPGLFALNAWLTGVSGLAPAAYAAWAQVFFNLANVAALRFAVRGVTGDERLLWTASWLFLLGNWVGQDYLAPQAFAFFLSLVLLGLCVRCGPPSLTPRSRAGRWTAARLDQLRKVVVRRASLDEPLPPAPLSPRAAVVVGGVCYLAVVITHQLTPVMLLGGVTVLALVVRRVPLWVPAAMAIVELWWLVLAWPYFRLHFDLFSFDPASNAAPAGYRAGEGLPGLTLVRYASGALVVLMTALAGIGLVRRARAAHWDLVAAALIVAPMLVFILQSYSGEGRYRVYLFSLPWLCFFAAAACAPVSRSRLTKALRGWRLALASAALGVCLLFAYFGLEAANRVTREDIAAGIWFDEHAPRNSVLVQMTSGGISRVTARYARVFDPDFPASPTLTDQAPYIDRRLGPRDLPRLEATLRGYGGRHTYLLLTLSQRRFARLYGVLPAGWQKSLVAALRSSPSFRLVYRRGTSSIFRYDRGGTVQ